MKTEEGNSNLELDNKLKKLGIKVNDKYGHDTSNTLKNLLIILFESKLVEIDEIK